MKAFTTTIKPCTQAARASRLARDERHRRNAEAWIGLALADVPMRERDDYRTALLAAVVRTEPCPAVAISKLGVLAGRLGINRLPRASSAAERVFRGVA